MSKRKKIIIGVVAACITIAIIVGASFYGYVYYSYQKKSYVNTNTNNVEINEIEDDNELDKNLDEETTNIEEDIPETDKAIEEESEEEKVDFKEVEGITNILLIGTDAREYDKKSRADTIMIFTIDDIHKKLKLTSIMRDTYAKIPGYGEQKINHSFAYGKTDLLMKTIEENFKIKLDQYAIINFMGFKELVDAIGGLDIEVNEEQRQELNRCIIGLENYKENFFDEEPHYLMESGMQHLDGQQVLAYSRMRHIERGGYSRTERQRNVVNMIIDKLKDTSILKYPQVATDLMPFLRTNIGFNDALNLAYTVYKIDNFDIEQLQIPVIKLSHSMLYKDKGSVLLIDKENTTKVIQEFIFDDIALDLSKYEKFSYASSEYYYVPEPEVKSEEKDKTTEGIEKNSGQADDSSDQENKENDGNDENKVNEKDGQEINEDLEINQEGQSNQEEQPNEEIQEEQHNSDLAENQEQVEIKEEEKQDEVTEETQEENKEETSQQENTEGQEEINEQENTEQHENSDGNDTNSDDKQNDDNSEQASQNNEDLDANQQEKVNSENDTICDTNNSGDDV